MQAYHASWQDSHSSDFTSVTIQCTLVASQGLCFLRDGVENTWAFAEIQVKEAEDTGFVLYQSTRPQVQIHSEAYALLDQLLPYLSGASRQNALALYANHRPQRSKWLLGGILLGMLLFAGVLWLFFWGQIQLRKQQLAIADPKLVERLGERHQAQLKETLFVCQEPELKTFGDALYRQYQQFVPDTQLKSIRVFSSTQTEALMLSNGHLFLSTALLHEISEPTLWALLSHQEGHLRLNHRLESRIYEQGNRIFYRLWQDGEDPEFLLGAPLWVMYSRGQEAAADHWAFTHLNEAGLSNVDFQGFAKYMLVAMEDVSQAKGFVKRHPMATDRLQGLAQRQTLKILSKMSEEKITSDLWRKALKNCEKESMSK